MNTIEPKLIEKPLAWCLLFCRIAVFIIFAAWSYDKFVRPEHGVEILATYYLIPGISETVVLMFGILQLVMLILLICGLFKRLVRGFFLALSVIAVSAPGVLKGYVDAILVVPHPTILFYTGFCVLACCFSLYYLRDYDTKFSLGTRAADTGSEK